MAGPLLALRGITHRYPGAATRAVDALTLAVPEGELLALVGASGSGKSTTLRIVAGYEPPQQGTVLFDGTDITRLAPERRGFGVVFQHHALLPHLSVEDNVAFGLEARGVGRAERRARARQALAAMGLDGMGPRAVQALSGGEQQRVAIARALIIEPRVLLLDEPLSSLDPGLRVALRDELRPLLRGRHATTLFVTHDQEDAFAVADRVALLDAGRVLQVDTPEALYDRPASAAVAAFIGRGTLIAAALVDGRDGGAPDVALTVAGRTQRAPARLAAGLAGTPGRSVRAVLRPEQLVLVAPDAPDAWPGRVVARRFAGGTTACRVALDDGPVVLLAAVERGTREGDRVGVRLAAPALAVVDG